MHASPYLNCDVCMRVLYMHECVRTPVSLVCITSISIVSIYVCMYVDAAAAPSDISECGALAQLPERIPGLRGPEEHRATLPYRGRRFLLRSALPKELSDAPAAGEEGQAHLLCTYIV